MSSAGRKRKATVSVSQSGAITIKNPLYRPMPKAVKAMVVPGFTRSSGFYGKFGKNSKYPNQELKFFDTSNSFFFDNTGEVPATGQLALIPQGDTESTRDGRMAYIKSIQIQGYMQFDPAAAADASVVAYLWLVLDKQCNGAAATLSDVVVTQGTSEMGRALPNLANSQRFTVLKKWTVPFNTMSGVSGAYNTMIKNVSFYKKCNIPIVYSSTTGAIGEIRSNNLFFLAGLVGGDDIASFTGQTRLRFLD